MRRLWRAGSGGRPQTNGRARALSWAVATRVASSHGRHLAHAHRSQDQGQRGPQDPRGSLKLEIIRCIKRYLAREIYYLMHEPTTLATAA
jgi:hypothetical protein